MTRTRLTATIAAAAAVFALAGCSDNDGNPEPQSTPIVPGTYEGEPGAPTSAGATTTKGTGGVYAPIDTAVGKSGLEASILSVEDATSAYGPVVVFTFQIVNTTDELWEGFNWMTPTVVYGDAGVPAEHVNSIADGYGNGVQGAIPPGSRQSVKHAYKVSKAQLNPAVVTASSVVWSGDFSTFAR
ncbi:hypothetical protein [Nocardia cyriacigeorgica]|uniref:hypothetical protein n=1 Tax=Nocardia cyriacigeorgica TaxID=135487 RepID=UPI001893F041|nr:hypothetical protein [Nocardia cyriacigeorgica]MBF6416976.1 hypothetical protein [Nocardia cyriacigeorgica]